MDYTNILDERTDCILYQVSPGPSEHGTGWIGGMHLTSLMIKQTSSMKVTKNITFT
ncbi:hypothetical protein D3C76_411350 [compost metagenome]